MIYTVTVSDDVFRCLIMKPSASDTLLPSSASSSGSSSPPIGLQSPKLQEEFLQGKCNTNTTTAERMNFMSESVPDGPHLSVSSISGQVSVS